MREEGYYWIKEDNEWIIGQFKNESWRFCDPMLDCPGGWCDEDLDEIDENRIKRLREQDNSEIINDWKICPKCTGSGYRMPYPGGFEAQDAKLNGTATITCDLCNGKKIISKVNGLPPTQ